jgi:hypothetical protein
MIGTSTALRAPRCAGSRLSSKIVNAAELPSSTVLRLRNTARLNDMTSENPP